MVLSTAKLCFDSYTCASKCYILGICHFSDLLITQVFRDFTENGAVSEARTWELLRRCRMLYQLAYFCFRIENFIWIKFLFQFIHIEICSTYFFQSIKVNKDMLFFGFLHIFLSAKSAEAAKVCPCNRFSGLLQLHLLRSTLRHHWSEQLLQASFYSNQLFSGQRERHCGLGCRCLV